MNLQLLKDPFPESDIEWRVGSVSKDGKKGTALAYLTNRAIMDRLDSAVGPELWKNDFREWKGGQLCGISIFINNEWITKWDGADDSKIEPTKGGLSDAMKRAAVQWGIGRYLYDLDTSWVALDEWKHIITVPSLPKWALPVGAEPKKKEAPEQAPTKEQPKEAVKETPKSDNELISEKQVKELQDSILKKHGQDNFVTCIKELNASLKIEKMKMIKISDLIHCREFIDFWSDIALPFSVAPESE